MEFGLATGLGLGLGLGLGRVSHGAGVMTAMLRHAMLCPEGGEVCVSGEHTPAGGSSGTRARFLRICASLSCTRSGSG